MTTLLAGGCAYNGYYTDYPYYGDYYYPYSYPYYASYYPYSYPYYEGYYPYYGFSGGSLIRHGDHHGKHFGHGHGGGHHGVAVIMGATTERAGTPQPASHPGPPAAMFRVAVAPLDPPSVDHR